MENIINCYSNFIAVDSNLLTQVASYRNRYSSGTLTYGKIAFSHAKRKDNGYIPCHIMQHR